MDQHEPVVTYSRMPSTASRRRGASMAARREPTLDAAEIHLMDAHERAASDFAAVPPELRADPVAADAIKRGRRGSTPFVLFGACLAILAGVGVLAATFGTATIVPREAPVETASDEPAPLDLTPGDIDADKAAPGEVRKISLNGDEEVPAAAAAESTPPVPRPRPEVATASAEPQSGAVAVLPPPSDAQAGKAQSAGTASSPAAATASAQPPALPAPQASPGGEDALILSIEDTLAKIDSSVPTGLPETTGSVSPPPSASSAPPAVYPPATYPRAGNGYPPAGASIPQSRGPYYDVMPLPAPPAGYGEAIPPGPVPPEPVPYVYPPSPIVYPPSYVEAPPEVRRRGIVRRTADAVVRVFSRD